MHKDSHWTWTIGCAAAPGALLGIALIALIAMPVLNGTAFLLADVVANWLFVLMITALLFAPAIAVTVYGAERFERYPRAARVIATIGLVWIAVLYVVIVVVGFRDTAPIPPSVSETRWAPQLTVAEASIFAAPFLFLTLANAYALLLLWKRPVPGPLAS